MTDIKNITRQILSEAPDFDSVGKQREFSESELVAAIASSLTTSVFEAEKILAELLAAGLDNFIIPNIAYNDNYPDYDLFAFANSKDWMEQYEIDQYTQTMERYNRLLMENQLHERRIKTI